MSKFSLTSPILFLSSVGIFVMITLNPVSVNCSRVVFCFPEVLPYKYIFLKLGACSFMSSFCLSFSMFSGYWVDQLRLSVWRERLCIGGILRGAVVQSPCCRSLVLPGFPRVDFTRPPAAAGLGLLLAPRPAACEAQLHLSGGTRAGQGCMPAAVAGRHFGGSQCR